DVDDRRVGEVRMIAVAGDAERASSQDRDVVRLRGVRGALPVLRERILVRELRHIGGGTVDVRDVMVLHEDDDELVEVARGLRRQVSRLCDRHGSRDRDEARSEQRDDDQEDRGQGVAEGSPHADPPVRSARTTRNKAKGHETPKGRSGRDREEDSTSNVPEVVDSRPALSTAFTQTWWGPLDKWRVVLVAVPTDRNGPPSMLTSCLAIPEAS